MSEAVQARIWAASIIFIVSAKQIKNGNKAKCADLEHSPALTNLSPSLARETKMSLREAAQAMGIGATTLRRLVADGEMPVIKLDGRLVFLERDINDFLAGRYGPVIRTQRVRQKLKMQQNVLNSDVLKKG